jgi:hypothetical protein
MWGGESLGMVEGCLREAFFDDGYYSCFGRDSGFRGQGRLISDAGRSDGLAQRGETSLQKCKLEERIIHKIIQILAETGLDEPKDLVIRNFIATLFDTIIEPERGKRN